MQFTRGERERSHIRSATSIKDFDRKPAVVLDGRPEGAQRQQGGGGRIL